MRNDEREESEHEREEDDDNGIGRGGGEDDAIESESDDERDVVVHETKEQERGETEGGVNGREEEGRERSHARGEEGTARRRRKVSPPSPPGILAAGQQGGGNVPLTTTTTTTTTTTATATMSTLASEQLRAPASAGEGGTAVTNSPTIRYKSSLWHLDTLNAETIIGDDSMPEASLRFRANDASGEVEMIVGGNAATPESPSKARRDESAPWMTHLPKEKNKAGIFSRCCNGSSLAASGNATYPCCDERGTLLIKALRKHAELAVIRFRTRPWLDTLALVFPCITWIKGYKVRQYLWLDIVSGLSVGAMVVPQSMSYARIAGLPTQFGLYAAFVPIFAYAIFGSSRQLAVGPVALVSLLVYSGLSDFVETDADGNINQAQFNMMAVQLAFLAGLAQFILGVLRFGFVVNFLSHAVISGFTTGAAIIIGLSQVGGILGYKIDKTSGWPGVAATIYDIFKKIDQFNYKTFLMGIGFIAMLLTFKELGKRNAKLKFLRTVGPLTAAAIGITIVWSARLDKKGIPIVGEIPKGLPPATVKYWGTISELGKMIVTAISISLVGFLESIAIAKNLAAKNGYEINANQELTGLGLANFLGAAFSTYPVTGSFSRSAVNNDTGAKTGLAGVVTGLVVLLTLLVLAPVLKWLPIAALSAIVISSVIGLLDYPEAIFLWKSDLRDFFIWVIALLGTLFLGVEVGLLIAVGISLLFVIYESAYPHIAVLGKLPGTQIYRNVKQYAEAEQAAGVLVLRIDAPVYFANVAYVKDRLRKHERRSHTLYGVPLSFVVLELGPVTHMDSTALHALTLIQKEYVQRSVQLVLANPGSRVLKQLDKGGVIELIGRDNVFVRSHDAVEYCKSIIGNNFDRPMGGSVRAAHEPARGPAHDVVGGGDDVDDDDVETGTTHVTAPSPRQRIGVSRSLMPSLSRRGLLGSADADTSSTRSLPGELP